ncbi:MAG: glycerol-3-phosphate 1-O-acyltransferase PlsY [Phascolarctobacterium sp.]|nr:glycerol-3-phosphate 1-O-acyltransferase PlsY [Phascolarctobacterium sp.]MBQ8690779.1 glycerol-3-phosphate 1-O-acyltransferase PlsY [Phascolarctobacterium sp.]MBR2140132.1 glycerol-3-phosphate 1-O-acyltransferase PlsY [Phascolarctobacterium sp.]MBR6679200.1 glycerol-3-phosphate 1-O-acyltransferase PlsY [Phascolarctobacterium sp.]
MHYVLGYALGHLFGSVPCGLWIVQALHGIDIREYGSKNIGTTNVFRTVGAKTAALVMAADMLKGIIAVALINYLFHDHMVNVVTALGAVLGHSYSLFLGLKGGKGVATGLGLLLYLMPEACTISFGVWLVTVLITRYVSLGSIIASLTTPVLAWYFDYPVSYICLSVLCTFFIVIRHTENIKRLLNGTESKIKQGKADDLKK